MRSLLRPFLFLLLFFLVFSLAKSPLLWRSRMASLYSHKPISSLLEREEKLLAGEAALRRQTQALPSLLEEAFLSPSDLQIASVSYRDPSTASCHLWIRPLKGEALPLKYSPVLSGMALIGMVDAVGSRESRVKLITAPDLHIAVRVARGAESDRHLLHSTEALLVALTEHKDNVAFGNLYKELKAIETKLGNKKESFYLAKGELSGSRDLRWRKSRALLKGEGFQYDFADAWGPSRDLKRHDELLRIGDLLVTSGMDAFFPPWIRVARIVDIDPLEEGDTHYSLSALPCALRLSDLQYVSLLPPKYYP